MGAALDRARTSVLALRPCADAQEWILSVSGGTPSQAWARCPRGDWMLWLAARAEVDRRLVVLAACECARLALPYVPSGEDRPRAAIETAERWTRGEATMAEVRGAAAYAYAAAYAAYAAAYAADAAAYAADAAAYAAAAYARTRALRKCAAIVRRHIPWRVVAAALAARGVP